MGKSNIAEITFQWEGAATFAAGITDTATSFTVEDSRSFPEPPFHITVDAEIMEIGSLDRSTHTFSNVLRGLDGTTAAEHKKDANIEVRKTLKHTLWWRLTDTTKILPLTRFMVPLGFDEPNYPRPRLPEEIDE